MIERLRITRKAVMIDPKDCLFDAVRGGGPGGQAVSKTSNMAVLVHKPTGTVVKCHETRSLELNKKRAWKNLERILDNQINGEASLENLKALKERAKKQVKANKSKKKHQKTGIATSDK